MVKISITIWKPQKKQIEFMQRPEYECLYGGSAGGGKSDALVAEALRQVHIPWYKGLLIRKTYPQLSELIDKSRNMYPRAFPKARYNDSKHCWFFPSGAKIIFGSMNTSKDKYNYQGLAFDLIGFDELTHFTYDEYMYLMSRNRPNGPNTRVYMRATANPGGIGHGWVKERFITPVTPGNTITENVTIIKPDGSKEKRNRSRIFIPANVFDNKQLLDNDPNYVANLAMLPDAEKKALLYGDWDSFDGQVFTEWKNDSEHYNDGKWTHVINPFRIPEYWKIYRGFDFGYAKPFSVGWYAVDTKGKIYRIKEWYGCTDTPNTGIKITPYDIARGIKEIEENDPMLKGKKITGIADPSIWDESRGESIAEMMCKSPNFVTWSPGDNNRIPGKMQYHYRLAFDNNGDSMFQVFNTCKHFIRTIPTLIYDKKKVEDIDTSQEDHIYDECRYVFMENPIAIRKNEKKHIPLDDPLNMFEDVQKESKKDKYYFYRM